MRPVPEQEQTCVCSKCGATTKAFPDADGKWDCEECGHRHYPSKRDFGKRSQERELTAEGSEPSPKEVTVVVGVCGNVAFTAVEPSDCSRDCMTECLADCIKESGRYTIKCNAHKSGDPMASDYGYECSPTITKIEEAE